MRIGRLLKITKVKFFNRNIHIGKGAIIDFGVKIQTNGHFLSVGENVYLRSLKRGYHTSMPVPTTLLIDCKNATIKIGNFTRINGAFIHSQRNIQIGKNCVIASGVQILDSNGHELLSSDRTKGRDKPEEIIIGDNVWIGINAIVLKGSKIGDNSVISAGSIVKGVFPPNSLIVGNPGKFVKKLSI